MRNLIIRRPDSILLLLAGYFALQFVVRLIMPDAMRYDEAQQAFFSQWMVQGYDSQPPLYNWIQSAFVSVFGLSMASIAFVKAVALVLLYASHYRLARELLTDKLFAALSTLSLMTIPQIFWEAQRDLTHSVALVICINLFLLAAIRTIKAPSTFLYAMLGLTAGLGMISKYNFALVFFGTFVAVALNPDWRSRLFDRRILISALVGILVVLPHGLWLIDNLSIASGKTLSIMAQEAPENALAKLLQGPLRFLRIVLVILAPLVAVYVFAFRQELVRSLRQSTQWTRFFEHFFLTVILTILLLILTIGMTALRDRWLMPFVALVPIWLCLKLQASAVRPSDYAQRLLIVPLIVMCLAPIALVLRTNAPQLFGSYQAYNMPYGDFLEHVTAEEGRRPGLMLADNWLTAGNLHLQMPDVPAMAIVYDHLNAAYQWTAEKPILLVWLGSDGSAVPKSLTTWLDQKGTAYRLGEVRLLDLPYQHSFNEEKARFGYAWVYTR
ncbi:ArnT family glycosyltransferase [Rhizobium sp. G187]|uniref:ArnT family glycosyltransferase n=1 Tax=Rhizobium sp. G187 TaxID=3451352 RepID=UPI003EE6CD8A